MRYQAFTLLVVAAAITAAGCSRKSASVPSEKATPVAVSTTRASMVARPSTFEAGGIVRARVTAAVASRARAVVTDVTVRPGDRVRRGAPLVLLDAREPQANRDRADAAATAAAASAVAADADIVGAEAGLALARATHQRIADLATRRSATPQELDQAVAALASAEAQVRSAHARRAAADAQLDAARAAAAGTATSLTYTQLTAPFAGIVSERSVDPGAMAVPGVPLLLLEDPASLRLEAKVDESRAAQTRVGDTVDVMVGTTPDRTAATWTPARVAEIARVDAASHAFVVKVELPASADLRTGTFGRVRFRGPTRTVLAVPSSALIRRGQLSFLFVVDDDHVARFRAVSPGAATNDQVEILAGVNDGDLVVVAPPPELGDGRRVETAALAAREGGGR